MAMFGFLVVTACVKALRADTIPVTVSGVPGSQVTWEACVRLAITHNPELQASREAVLNSDAVRMGAYSALYPQISLSFNEGRSFQNGGLFSPNNYSSSYSEQISLSQTIFNGFATKGNIDRARAQLNVAFANMDAQKASTSYSLKAAFTQLLYAQKLIALSRNVINIRQNTAHLVKLLYEGGSEDKGAMLLSQANLDQALNALDQAQRTYDLSGLQLSVAIGQPLPAPILGEGELTTQPLPVTPDFRQLAVQTPTYFQQRAQTDAAAAGVTVAESGWYPSISAGASASRSDSHFPLKNDGWSAGLSVSYPLFEGGQTYFSVKAATASLREALDSLRSGTDQSALTLAQAFKSMVDVRDNVRIQLELLAAAELRYKIAEARYRNGLMSFQDFNSITDTYVTQQQTCLAAQRDAVITEANWEQVRGVGAIP